jgi:hypothetical protein
MDNEKNIAEKYKEFWNIAFDLAEKETKIFPLEGKETLKDRTYKHLMGMLSMYSATVMGSGN